MNAPKTCADFRPRMLLLENVEDLTIRDVTLKGRRLLDAAHGRLPPRAD